MRRIPNTITIFGEPLCAHTTFKIGGPADYFVIPSTVQALLGAADAAREAGLPWFVMGGGSNILAPDRGYKGVVISTSAMTNIRVFEPFVIEAECGAMLGKVAAFARDKELAGLEFAQGIPGTVGGGVFMNAGAYGGELAHSVISTDYLDADGILRTVSGSAQSFGYRKSLFSEQQGSVILRSRFRLRAGNRSEIENMMEDYRRKRRSMQPLEFPSAGSAFKRPEGKFAGKLIADAGLKGYRVGGAEVSEKHAGFIINVGGATAEDVLELIDIIRGRVFEVHGIELEPEIRMM